MPLSELKIKSAKTKEKSYKLSDAEGLFLLIHTNGSKYWRFRYRFSGKEKLLAIGTYPTISLYEARKARDNAKILLANHIDPLLE